MTSRLSMVARTRAKRASQPTLKRVRPTPRSPKLTESETPTSKIIQGPEPRVSAEDSGKLLWITLTLTKRSSLSVPSQSLSTMTKKRTAKHNF